MNVFGINIRVQAFDLGLNRLAKWKMELVLVMAVVLVAWMDSVQTLNSLSFVLDHLIEL